MNQSGGWVEVLWLRPLWGMGALWCLNHPRGPCCPRPHVSSGPTGSCCWWAEMGAGPSSPGRKACGDFRVKSSMLCGFWVVSVISTGVAWDLLWIFTRMNFIWQIKKKTQSICAKTERNVNTSITWGRSSKVMMEKIKELLFLAGNSWELVS